ncbi:F-box/kelch-repeat protein At3g23880-like [Arachis ipaensis]|uniref:F-box/kelch-repeat protein At3g23880-like n=1 Tax=Arachis ipaensis TaxID=130454 RepID=UPI0007AF6446|nr:F-box/kelch-repeat protein At3g23880-like [Arachis ipaensis]XP_029150614.1 F-box/kelch-repeat protein At3g23880-like [Arachis hypogaea]QHN97945.1 F-box/kelch-repeat protein [Arachis hypogaea]
MPTDDNDAETKAATGTELVSCPTARTRQLSDVSDEIMMEILLRFPVRTLASLRSVCTSWRNLISSPPFTCNHLRRSCLLDPTLTTLRIAYCTWAYRNDVRCGTIGLLSVHSILDNPSEPTQVDCFREQRYYGIIGSCNGLLCLVDEHAFKYMHAILWNPCTGFTFESPEISGEVRFCGFGYDHLSDSYKIFATIRTEGPSDFEFSTRIYTFGPTSSWRKIDDIPVALFGVPIDNPSWAVNREGEFFGSSILCTLNWCVNHVVLYFDLGKETYGHFPLPDSDINLDRHYFPRLCTHLCVLRNCLSVCYGDKSTYGCFLYDWNVWQMKEYGDAQSWTKLAVIPVYENFTYSDPCRCFQPLYISESDVLLAFCPFFGIVLCNLNDGSVDFPEIDNSGMGNHPAFSQCVGYRMACIYHDSLVSPNGLRSNSSKMLLRFIKPKLKLIDS